MFAQFSLDDSLQPVKPTFVFSTSFYYFNILWDSPFNHFLRKGDNCSLFLESVIVHPFSVNYHLALVLSCKDRVYIPLSSWPLYIHGLDILITDSFYSHLQYSISIHFNTRIQFFFDFSIHGFNSSLTFQYSSNNFPGSSKMFNIFQQL